MIDTFYIKENMAKFICVTTNCAIAISKEAFLFKKQLSFYKKTKINFSFHLSFLQILM
jgi:hypothetical protein